MKLPGIVFPNKASHAMYRRKTLQENEAILQNGKGAH